MEKKRILGNLMLLLTALIWGLSFVFQRVGMDHIEPLTFGSARSVLAAMALGLLVWFTDRRKKRLGLEEKRSPQEIADHRRNTLRGGVFCGVFLTLAASFQQMGIVYTTAGKTGFITALYIVFVPVIGWLFLKKRITWLIGVGVVLATVGMYFLSIGEEFVLTKGDAGLLVCAIFLPSISELHFVQIADPLNVHDPVYRVRSHLRLGGFAFETPTQLNWSLRRSQYLFRYLSGVGVYAQMVAQKFTDPPWPPVAEPEAVFGVLGGWP